MVEAFVPDIAADRENSSLAFLVAVSWHVEEYTHVALSALTMLSAFLDTVVLMCNE